MTATPDATGSPQDAGGLSRRAALATVAVSSGAVLVLEILSLRLVAPYVGITLETSTAVIGVALAAIAAGAWAGGRRADETPPAALVGPLLLVGGALVTFVTPAVRFSGSLVGSGDASAVLLLATVAVFIPAALLSAVTPVVIKLQLPDLAHAGTVVGGYSGAGTVGAIVATFGTGFVLVARWPTSAILLGLAVLLLAVGVAVTLRLRTSTSRLAALLAVAAVGGALTVLAPRPCDTETAYHCARVVADPQRPSGRVLELDTLRHSYVDLADPTYLQFTYIRSLASVADVMRPARVPLRALHLGGGGLTMPRYLAATRPGSDSVVLEIDPGVVAVDRSRLALRTGPKLQVRITDARVGVAREPADSRDLVVGDAFGGLAVPWHLTTREMLRDVARVLAPGGIYVANIIDHPPNAFARAEVATIATVFPNVAVLAEPGALANSRGGNFVVAASAALLPVDALRARLAARRSPVTVATGDAVSAFVGSAQVLTDDYAPVDQLLTPYGR